MLYIYIYTACVTDGKTEAPRSEIICQRSPRRLKSPAIADHSFISLEHAAQRVARQLCCSNQARLTVPH